MQLGNSYSRRKNKHNKPSPTVNNDSSQSPSCDGGDVIGSWTFLQKYPPNATLAMFLCLTINGQQPVSIVSYVVGGGYNVNLNYPSYVAGGNNFAITPNQIFVSVSGTVQGGV